MKKLNAKNNKPVDMTNTALDAVYDNLGKLLKTYGYEKALEIVKARNQRFIDSLEK